MSLHVHCCLTAALLLAGCRESTDRIQTFPARGQVLWEGQPLAGALVVLHPQSTSAPAPLPARAETDAQGNFILGTYDSEDGVPAGDYVITVHWHQLAQGGGLEPVRVEHHTVAVEDPELVTAETGCGHRIPYMDSASLKSSSSSTSKPTSEGTSNISGRSPIRSPTFLPSSASPRMI